MGRFLLILGAAALTLAFVRPAPVPLPGAARPEETAEKAPEKDANEAVEVAPAGLRVFVDPETGELVGEPSEEQLERLRLRISEKLRQRPSAWDLRQFSLRGGGQGVFLDGWADHEMVVRRADDGRLRTICSQGDNH